MFSKLDPPLKPRRGDRLQVLAVCRISTENQDERSLKDQQALYEDWLRAHTDIPYDLEVIAGKGSGENLERAEYLLALEMVESGQVDIVITEDVGRIARRIHAHMFAEVCEDVGTRLIAINDHLDTFRDDWRLCSFFAVMRHETYNRDTAARIRRSQRNRFQQGGLFQFPTYGYIKPPGAKSDADVVKDPAADPILREWFRRLEDGAGFAEIGDWLNGQGVKPGPYSRSGRWDGNMVGRVTRHTILKGLRQHNNKVSRRINKTGRRHCVKAPPEERQERVCPHLAFFDANYYDRVLRIVNARNAHCRRRGADGRDSRLGMPRKRTTWPGQHIRCGICGRLYYWYGSTELRHMKCSGAQAYKCWSAVEVNGDFIGQRLAQAILAEIMALPDFDAVLLEKLREHWEGGRAEAAARRHDVRQRRTAVEQKIARVTTAIADIGGSQSLQEKLRELETERQSLDEELTRLDQVQAAAPVLPSLDLIKRKAQEVFCTFAAEDQEVYRLMRQLIPDLRVYPYQICDGGAVELRAHFQLDLASLSGTPWPGAVPPVLRRDMVVDLFHAPQRVRYRQQIMAMRAGGLKERQIAAQLRLTKPAVARAAALSRRMEQLGLTDPYIRLTDPPSQSGLRRHLHPRYRFEPLRDQPADP
jgi:DNA invertase Pin-like site-specific DNA recombinase